MRRYIVVQLIFLTTYSLLAQQGAPYEQAEALAETITVQDLKTHLGTLASDEYEGRETGTPGQKKAADYIASIFEKWELPTIGTEGDYFQKIEFNAATWDTIQLTLNNEPVSHLRSFYASPQLNPEHFDAVFEEILFLGYGIDDPAYSDYSGANVEGKAILIYGGEPFNKKGQYLISGNQEPSVWSLSLKKKLEVAKENGVLAVLIISSNFKKDLQAARRQLLNRSLQLGDGRVSDRYPANCVISSTLAKDLIDKRLNKVIKVRKKIQKRGKSKRLEVPTQLRLNLDKDLYQLSGENVMGFIEGSDPNLKDEVVVLSAHYDHLGKRGDAIYNGADDNASGTSTVLEVLEAFKEAKSRGVGARRSVLGLLVSGEEKGLLGSKYYVENPVIPLEQLVVDINVDMVGRVDKKHTGNPNYVYVIGSDRLSSDLHQINEDANSKFTKLELDYTYNAEDDPNRFYYRSDHYNFAKNGIPSIFYFNGTHADYHRITDTAEKIEYEKMAKIGKLIFHTAWEIANRDERLRVDKKN